MSVDKEMDSRIRVDDLKLGIIKLLIKASDKNPELTTNEIDATLLELLTDANNMGLKDDNAN